MIIVGLDPGSLRTGYAVVAAEGSRLTWLDGGTWRPRAGEALGRRLQLLHSALGELLARVRPDAVAMEECFMGRHARAALVLGHARGALMVAALARDVELFEYAPRLVKLAVTGTGGASKEQVQAMVPRLAAGTPAGLGADAADALAVAICHAHRAPAARRHAVLGEVLP
jgi:crossover junction endodeoxyribonuclease RuvC